MIEPDLALKKLKEGNRRFVENLAHSPRQSSECRLRQIENQNPFCAILACSDSRVPVEILFDQGIGDLFVVRLAGNVASKAAVESLDFATHVLKVSLIVVMGHQNCGAVHAVIHHLADKDLSEIASLIHPGADQKPSLKEAVLGNIEVQVKSVQSHPLLQPQFEQGELKVVGAYYDFETGIVNFL